MQTFCLKYVQFLLACQHCSQGLQEYLEDMFDNKGVRISVSNDKTIIKVSKQFTLWYQATKWAKMKPMNIDLIFDHERYLIGFEDVDMDIPERRFHNLSKKYFPFGSYRGGTHFESTKIKSRYWMQEPSSAQAALLLFCGMEEINHIHYEEEFKMKEFLLEMQKKV